MQEKTISEQQSIELISQMLQQTQARIVRNSGRPFLIWGYTTLVISILEFCLFNQSMAWRWLWFAIPVVGWGLMYLFSRNDSREPQARNYIDRVISSIWIVFGISSMFAFATAIFYHTSIFHLMALFMGMGTAITGLVIRFRWVTISGFAAMFSSLLFVWFKYNPEYYRFIPLLFALIFAFMMIIPGHILNYKTRVCSRN